MRRAAVLAATVALLGASLAGPVGAQEPTKFTAKPLDDGGVTIQAFKSGSSPRRESPIPGFSRARMTSRSTCSLSWMWTGPPPTPVASRAFRTSPTVTGKKLKENKAAVGKYRAYVRSVNDASCRDDRIGGPEGDGGVVLRRRLRRRARPPARGLGEDAPRHPRRRGDPGDSLNQPLTDTTPTFIGATVAGRRSVGPRPPARASSSASSTPASGPSTRRSRTRASRSPAAGRTAASSATARSRRSARRSRATTS